MQWRWTACAAALTFGVLVTGCPEGEKAPPSGVSADGGAGTDDAGDSSSGGSGSTGTGSGSADDTGEGGGVGDGEFGPVLLDCGEIPSAAVAAEFSHTPSPSGGDSDFEFDATGLPDGLSIDGKDGEISGVPTESGTFDAQVTVTDGEGTMVTETCQLQVNPQLGVVTPEDLLGEDVCVRDSGSLHDFIVEGTGDGTPIACDFKSGSGNGRLPAGITVNADTCQMEGTITDDTFGTHAFIVRGEQSGAYIYMPYCVLQDDSANTYTVDGSHSGATGVADVPIVRLFDPLGSLSVGMSGDPIYSAIDPTACTPSSCYYGFVYALNTSPFDSSTFDVIDAMLIDDVGGDPIGMQHSLTVGGDSVARSFQARAWIQNATMFYCLSNVSTTCSGVANIQANAGAELEVSIIMYPQ